VPGRHWVERAVGHEDEHRHGFVIRDEVVEDDLRMATATPFFFVAADAVEEVEDGNFFSAE